MSNEVEETVTPDAPPPKKSCPFSGRRACILFFLLAFFALLAGEGFSYYYFAKSKAKLTAAIAELQTAQKQTDMTELQQNVAAALQSNRELQEAFDHLQHTLTQDAAQAQQTNKYKLALAQASQYVTLANDNLQYANNLPVAMTLLKMADDTVRDIADPNLDAVRKALASDIAALQGTRVVDVTGLYMRLAALNHQLDQLPLPNKMVNAEAKAANAAIAEPQTWWQRGLQATWLALQKIVVVRYHENGALPLVTPEQQAFLYQNLHAMIAQAMWALLHGQSAIYQASLQQTAEWVKNYFSSEAPLTQAVMNELSQLQSVDIHPANPTITDSLQAFQAVKQEN